MTERISERYMDVFQNIEFAIISVYHEHPELVDSQVDRALEGLVRTYNAEAKQRPAPSIKLTPLDEQIYSRVHDM